MSQWQKVVGMFFVSLSSSSIITFISRFLWYHKNSKTNYLCNIEVKILSTLLEHYTNWMMFRKLKTVLPSLKPRVPFVLRSRIVYKIKCPHCEVSYVGMTTRHLLTRFREHKSRSSGTIKKHFTECTNNQIRHGYFDFYYKEWHTLVSFRGSVYVY